MRGMKTIFIVIGRGIVVRNILRNRWFKALSQRSDIKIVILFLNAFNGAVPEYLLKDFCRENVILEFVKNTSKSKLERFYRNVIKLLVYTKSSQVFIVKKIVAHKRAGALISFLINVIYGFLSRITILKKMVRRIEPFIFLDKEIDAYFDKYKPDLVFSTSILTVLDIDVLKAAKRRRIKTIGMPKSWDNIDKILFRVEPDVFLVQNQYMKDGTIKQQAIEADKIKVVGFPQFDIYRQPEIIWPKEEYCRKKNFDPGLPILFLGSEGAWSSGDESVFREIILDRESGRLPNCNILVRPHFSNAYLNKYDEFRNFKNVFVDNNNYGRSDFFWDRWEPTLDNQIDFINSLYYCNLMISFASTLVLDAACFDKPTLNIRYAIDAVKDVYNIVYYSAIISTGAIKISASRDELIKDIRHILQNDDYKKNERRLLRENFCGILDGESGKRIVQAVLEYLYEGQHSAIAASNK